MITLPAMLSFGFSGIKAMVVNWKVTLAVLGAIGVGAFVWHYNGLVASLDEAKNSIKLQQEAIASQSEVIDSLTDDIDLQRTITLKMDAEFKSAQTAAVRQKKKFNETKTGKSRDFGKLIDRHPTMLEGIINKATDDTMRCLELTSGAPITPKDTQNGNSQCPQLIHRTSSK